MQKFESAGELPAVAADVPRGAGNGLDTYVLEKIVTALEARMGEHLGQVDRRLAETEAKTALELQALERRRGANLAAVEQGIQDLVATCRAEIAAVGRRSSEQIAGLDQKLLGMRGELPPEIEARINACMSALETRVQNDFREAVERTADLISQIMQTTVLPRIVLLEADIRRLEALNALRHMSAHAEQEAHARQLLREASRNAWAEPRPIASPMLAAGDSPIAAEPVSSAPDADAPDLLDSGQPARPLSILLGAEERPRAWIIPLIACLLAVMLGLVLLRFM